MNIDLSKVQKMLDWLKLKLFLDSNAQSATKRQVKRGQVYKCNFGVGIGSEMQKERPCVIIQNDIANMKSPNTIVLPVTHDTSTLPCIANITPQYNANEDLILDGQVNASNIVCVSKARIGDYICDVPSSDLKRIDEAIAKSVDLMKHYADLERKLKDKINYIEKIKSARNEAQDKLEEIRELLYLSEKDDIIENIKKVLTSTKN